LNFTYIKEISMKKSIIVVTSVAITLASVAACAVTPVLHGTVLAPSGPKMAPGVQGTGVNPGSVLPTPAPTVHGTGVNPGSVLPTPVPAPVQAVHGTEIFRGPVVFTPEPTLHGTVVYPGAVKN
jgi:hypothetical protein